MDQLVAIQESLEEGKICRIAVQGVLVDGESRESRLLGLVESGGQRALHVYTHQRMAIAAEDVWLEQVIPITEEFVVEEVVLDSDLQVLGEFCGCFSACHVCSLGLVLGEADVGVLCW
ncbi:type II inositol 1,4,5-trisphosphate 5-phosphatase-like [Heliangelus exortis]|uniref:type II inositol 1,4,5-trisphosphate 5-phosphatase-like n=1 Tax=Heliangelus exortis TaxID=472823 RepID=UPI003A95B8D4